MTKKDYCKTAIENLKGNYHIFSERACKWSGLPLNLIYKSERLFKCQTNDLLLITFTSIYTCLCLSRARARHTTTSLTIIRLDGELKVHRCKTGTTTKATVMKLQLQTNVHRAKSFHNTFVCRHCGVNRRQPATALVALSLALSLSLFISLVCSYT